MVLRCAALAIVIVLVPVSAFGQAPGTWIERRPNAGVHGKVLQKEAVRNITACDSRCLRNKDCALFEFQSPGTCILFRSGTVAAEPGAHTAGIKHWPTPAKMRRLTKSYVEGKDYDTIQRSSPEACEEYCLADPKCLMVESYKRVNSSSCSLFDHRTVLPTGGNEAIVSVKEP